MVVKGKRLYKTAQKFIFEFAALDILRYSGGNSRKSRIPRMVKVEVPFKHTCFGELLISIKICKLIIKEYWKT